MAIWEDLWLWGWSERPIAYIFGALTVHDSGGPLATIARPSGGIERGRIAQRSQSWIFEALAQPVPSGGFGVDAAGSPYFDEAGVVPWESAVLWIDPTVGAVDGGVWLSHPVHGRVDLSVGAPGPDPIWVSVAA